MQQSIEPPILYGQIQERQEGEPLRTLLPRKQSASETESSSLTNSNLITTNF
ncbi:hypothetical protein BN903_19 [Halorubrum sp. AJ67]|nr:hypothetical protein BN903_19 [Halorubrum sp. AJ67]